MASRVSYGSMHHALGSMEMLARQAAIATPTLSGSILKWASKSSASRLALSNTLQTTYTPSMNSSIGISALPARFGLANNVTRRQPDVNASRWQDMLFEKQMGLASPTMLPRRIARLYARRPLCRQFPKNSARAFFTSSKFRSTPNSEPIAEEEQVKASGLMGKLKDLTRKYGWATVVVYLLFSAVDFGLCFFVINLVGAEHVRHAQDYILDVLVYGSHKDNLTITEESSQKGAGILGFLKEWREKHKAEDVENKKSGSSSMWSIAVLAYGIHKTLLLPVRLGATAATTPAIVKYLQRFGINIAKTPLPDSVKKRGAQSIKSGKERLDRAREKHKDWL